MGARHTLLGAMALAGGALIACGLELAGDGAVGIPPDRDGGTDAVAPDGAVLPDADGWKGCTAPALQFHAPWPALGGCTTHVGRSNFAGPAAEPKMVWAVGLRNPHHPIPAIGSDGIVYAPNDVDGVSGFFAEDGGLARAIKLDMGGNVTDVPTIAKTGAVYFQDSANVVGWFPDGGRWLANMGEESDSSPIVDDEGNVYAGSHNDRVWSMNGDTGEVRWKRESLGSDIKGSLAAGPSGDVYAPSRDGKLHAFRPDGGTAWQVQTGNAIESTPVVADDGTVYVGTMDKRLFSFNPDGTKRWEIATAGNFEWQILPAIGRDGTIYIATGSKLEAHRSDDGVVFWSIDLGGDSRMPVVIDVNGTIYAAGGEKIFAVDSSGVPRWSISPGCTPSSVAFAKDGHMIVGCNTRLQAWR